MGEAPRRRTKGDSEASGEVTSRPASRAAQGNGGTGHSDRALRERVCELLRVFHANGWASGTGGGLCARERDAVLFAPTGVHKERVQAADLFLENLASGQVLRPRNPALKMTECAPIFRAVIRLRGAGSVAHSHALGAVLAADTAEGDSLAISGFEMVKGIPGGDVRTPHPIPVIANTPRESELTGAVEAALADARFDRTFCVLVRDHGAYVWGADLDEAKKHAEVYHFLFQAHRARWESRRRFA